MHNESLVSCLCVTHNRVEKLRRAVSCFLKQNYEPRELVVVHQSDDSATKDYLATINGPSIRPVEVPASPRLTLGSLRNISLEASRSMYVALWDDDDWHGPTRLSVQIGAIQRSGIQGCVLWRLIFYDEETQKAFLSGTRPWEGSLVAERTAVPPYPDRLRGEDTPVISRMWAGKKLVFLDRPDLYFYIFHGKNTWDRAHWEEWLMPHAKPLRQVDAERVRALLAGDSS